LGSDNSTHTAHSGLSFIALFDTRFLPLNMDLKVCRHPSRYILCILISLAFLHTYFCEKIISNENPEDDGSNYLITDLSYQSRRLRDESKHIQLICDKNPAVSAAEFFSGGEHVNHKQYGEMIPHRFPRECPITYDYLGKIHNDPNDCVTSKQEKACIFHLKNVIVNRLGALIDNSTRLVYSYTHPSIAFMEPIHYHSVHIVFHSYFHESANKIEIPKSMKTYNLVIPARMIWDDIFNHQSHQSIPFIAHVLEFLPDAIWRTAHWHCSLHTGALLLLLGIPKTKLLIQAPGYETNRTIFAKEVIFPWIPGWTPPQTATLKGIANNVLRNITANLLAKFEASKPRIIKKRTIVYLSRLRRASRHVSNEEELLTLLRENINPDLYEIHVVEGTKDHNRIDELHEAWYESAVIFSKAKVIIGPHGAAFGNLMWAPDDVEYVEFNVFQDDKNFSSFKSKTHARPALINSAWAKGGTGRYYNIDPSIKSTPHFYVEDIRVAPYELLQILVAMNGSIIKEGYNSTRYQPEKHKERKTNKAKRVRI
jgi:hypothetical protein